MPFIFNNDFSHRFLCISIGHIFIASILMIDSMENDRLSAQFTMSIWFAITCSVACSMSYFSSFINK